MPVKDRWYAPAVEDPQRNDIGRPGYNACSMQTCLGGYSVQGELSSQVFRASRFWVFSMPSKL